MRLRIREGDEIQTQQSDVVRVSRCKPLKVRGETKWLEVYGKLKKSDGRMVELLHPLVFSREELEAVSILRKRRGGWSFIRAFGA